jgi:hypothetical protein
MSRQGRTQNGGKLFGQHLQHNFFGLVKKKRPIETTATSWWQFQGILNGHQRNDNMMSPIVDNVFDDLVSKRPLTSQTRQKKNTHLKQ